MSDGRVQFYYKLSLYSFRKLHATEFARELLDEGYRDIIALTMQHMGHSNPRTTIKYIKQLIDERPIVNSAYQKIEKLFNLNLPTIDRFQTRLK